MRRHGKFCLVIGLFLLLLLAGNALVWFGYTRHLLTRADGLRTGDLARMGYQASCIYPRRNDNDLPRHHLHAGQWRGEKVDLVTIGDSFSNGGGFGRNRYYQDYIASNQGMIVLNLPPLPDSDNSIETVAALLNSGYLEELGAHHVLIEMVERTCNTRLALPVDLERRMPVEEIRAFYARGPAGTGEEEALPAVGFLNIGNFKFLLYNLLYRHSDHAFISDVYRVQLERPLFSGASGDILLFLDKDIEMRRYTDPTAVARLNGNLNRLADRLSARGISLSFMPVVNKFTLYRPYVRANTYPESPFFPLLRSLPRHYRLIDTAAILGACLAGGEQDLFFVDDSHWSWKASQAIFEKERFFQSPPKG